MEEKHPGGRPSKDRVKRSFTIDRESAEYLDSLPDGQRSEFVNVSLRDRIERIQATNDKLRKIAQQAIAQAKDEGLDDEDAHWMAVGAINREARKQGIVGDEPSAEFNAAAQTIVKLAQS